MTRCCIIEYGMSKNEDVTPAESECEDVIIDHLLEKLGPCFPI